MYKQKGNITILVLIMAVVIILGTASMIGFVFRDINFTKIDEENLRALNIAEAGIANFQYRVKLYLEQEEELPESGYSQQITEGQEIEGSYTVSYQPVYDGDLISGFNITSVGTDSSQRQRTVEASLTIRRAMPFDIYNYIYSNESMNFGDITASKTSISGPFFSNGNLNLRGGVSFLDGPLYVNGDIFLGGSSSIGEAANPIDLYLSGVLENINGQEIDPLNPGNNDNVYVDQFSSDVLELPMLVIDDDYIQSLENTIEIDTDLTISDDSISAEGIESYLFYDDDGILNIEGNIIVNGDVTIGSRTGSLKSIYYKGNGKIIADGSITVYYQLVAENDFPQQSLLMLLSKSEINLDFGKSGGDPDGEFIAISNNNITLEEHTELWGSIIANHIQIDNNSEIYYVEGIREYLPQDLPQSQVFLSNEIIIDNWQEIRNQ